MRYYSKRFTMYYYPGDLVTGFSINPALKVHLLNTLGSILARCYPFTECIHATSSNNITFASYQVPIYTPGWRAAMWIKCLAEGQTVPGIDGIEPATLWSRVKGSSQYTMAPPKSYSESYSEHEKKLITSLQHILKFTASKFIIFGGKLLYYSLLSTKRMVVCVTKKINVVTSQKVVY